MKVATATVRHLAPRRPRPATGEVEIREPRGDVAAPSRMVPGTPTARAPARRHGHALRRRARARGRGYYVSRIRPSRSSVATPTPQAPGAGGELGHGGHSRRLDHRRPPRCTVARGRRLRRRATWHAVVRSSLGGPRDRPSCSHRRPGGHPLREPRRGGPGRPRAERLSEVGRPRRSSGWATTWWPAPTSAATSAWWWPAISTPCPPNDNAEPKIEGDVLWGLGSADMKGGLAVMLELATTVAEPGRRRHLGLLHGRRGGGRGQRAGAPVRAAPRPRGRRRRHPRRAHRRRSGGRMPGHHAGAGAPAGRGPTPPGRGWDATPCTGRSPAGCRSTSTRNAGRCSTAASTARRYRPSSRRAAWPATSCPTWPSVTLNHRFAPDRTADEAP